VTGYLYPQTKLDKKEDSTMKKKKKCIRKDDEAVSPVIAVILMVAITVVLAGVLYVWVNGITPPENPNSPISARISEKADYWELEIIKTGSGGLNIEDAKFQLIDASNIVHYKVDINDANPVPFQKGISKIYPLASSSLPISDNSTGSTITESSRLEDYENCYIAMIDQNMDDKISAGDTILIFKDFNNDGNNDVESSYKFEMLAGTDKILSKDL
jgi:flagellin-like protein